MAQSATRACVGRHVTAVSCPCMLNVAGGMDDDDNAAFGFRRRGFKSGLDVLDARKKRETTTNNIRKQKKEDQFAKRRQASLPQASMSPGAAVVAGGAYGAPPIPAEALLPTKNLDPSVKLRVRRVRVPCAYV